MINPEYRKFREDNNEEMEDNAYKEDGPGRQEMEMLRNTIAQSLMNAST
ncbi:hypothetical protein RchiOBHm_Chr2g0145791 [Rosa chinensis]|uniref:Uncharacterized protein n=1 Tax=Rosa chinensis TaxID=74649 RepID=A0A2P6RYR7_ROSCH|nr:hypothetical protein RchiOBHm_Chr2g0145791 [Rosa chinensis]